MHHCRAATLLFRSLRNEQTIVIGFQSTLVKVLTKWQVRSIRLCPALTRLSFPIRVGAVEQNSLDLPTFFTFKCA
jgi:hypothetical protein